jgi:hypothetical protein
MLSPEIETLDQLEGGDLSLTVIRTFYSDTETFLRAVNNILFKRGWASSLMGLGSFFYRHPALEALGYNTPPLAGLGCRSEKSSCLGWMSTRAKGGKAEASLPHRVKISPVRLRGAVGLVSSKLRRGTTSSPSERLRTFSEYFWRILARPLIQTRLSAAIRSGRLRGVLMLWDDAG